MAICSICGSTYDERAYQVAVPLLSDSFDKVDCAERALDRHLRASRLPHLAADLAAEVERLRAQLREVDPGRSA